MNVARLQRVKAQILAEPLKFDMEDWTRLVRHDDFCGTACCIGGFAALDAGFITLLKIPGAMNRLYEPTPTAPLHHIFRAALDLELSEADRLFLVSGWPSRFYAAYCDARTPKERADAAAKRIDHFIKTGGRE